MVKTKIEANPSEQSIEQLQQRYHDLHTKKIEADTNLKNAKDKLDELKEEARQKFGTDDLAELRKKLDAMKAENEEKRKNYQMELDRIDADLQNVETNLSAADGADNDIREQS